MKRITLFSLLTTIAAALIIAVIPATSNALGTASFSLSPASGSYNLNSSLVVGVYENGTSVNVVTANLTYNASQLQFVSISPAAGSFGGDVSSTGGSGNVSISRYVTPAGSTASGSTEVATIDFTVLVGTGSSTINFASSSLIESAGTNIWDGVNNAGSFNLTTPAPVTPPSTTTGGSGSTGSRSNGSGTKTTTSTTPAPTSTTTSTAPTAKGKVSNASTKKNNAKKINFRRTADTTSFYTYFWILVLLVAAGITTLGLAMRRKMVMSGDQGTFVKYVLGSTKKNASKVKTLAKKLARSSSSKN